MTSRGERPLSDRSSSPGKSPDRAAGDDSVTATTFGAVVTRGADMPTRLPGRTPASSPPPTGWLWGDPAGPGDRSGGGRRYPGSVPVERVILAEPRGFCAGVEKAIKALAWMVRVFEPPV